MQYFSWAPVGNKLVNLDRRVHLLPNHPKGGGFSPQSCVFRLSFGKTTCTLRSVLRVRHNESLTLAWKTWFLTASRTGCMKVSAQSRDWKMPVPAFPLHTSPPSRGDVLLGPGVLVVAWREARGLRGVQRHRGPSHRVQLVRAGAVPQHRFHPLSKG